MPESVDLARELVATVLGDALVRRAVEVDELLRKASALALVRAVELAERLLAGRALRAVPYRKEAT